MGKRRYRSGFDYTLLVIIIFLIAFGLVMLYSTSSYTAALEEGDAKFYLKKQLFNTVIGAGALGVGMLVDYHTWYKLDYLWYILAIVSVLSVLTPLGIEKNGARRWINLGIGTLQPTEIAKVAMIVFLAILVCKLGKSIKSIRAVGLMLALSMIVFFLVFIFNDNLSTAIIIMGIAGVMIFVAYPKYWPFAICGGLVILGVAILIAYLDSTQLADGANFRLGRLYVWRNPEAYADNKGFQVLQGLYAIGSGGIFGKGLGNSIQKLGFIPEAQNDMIFAIICEELGLFGAICVILAFMIMIWRLMVIAKDAPDLFGAMLAVGIMAHIAIQVILNIAVVTNTIPNTGVTLPFISYGGTSVTFLMFEMGLALNVSGQIKIRI